MISTMPLPRCSEIAKWDEPADVKRLTTYLRGLLPYYNQALPTAGLARAAQATAEALVAGGFTSAEIRFSMRRMWADKTMYWAFAKNYPLNPAAFIPHIYDLRRLQSALMFPARMETVQRLCAEFPDELHPQDFGKCSFDAMDNALYAYKHAGMIKEMGRKSTRLRDIPDAQSVGELLVAYTKEGEE